MRVCGGLEWGVGRGRREWEEGGRGSRQGCAASGGWAFRAGKRGREFCSVRVRTAGCDIGAAETRADPEGLDWMGLGAASNRSS